MSTLPPGQREAVDFPRFGLTPYASRFPSVLDSIQINITGCVKNKISMGSNFNEIERITQVSDFHCVTTWSKTQLEWSGYRFTDVYRHIIAPEASPHEDAYLAILRSQDGYRTALPIADLMAPDVMLADTLNGAPLCVAHGGPIRLVAPSHYGYKNVKHLSSIEFQPAEYRYRPAGLRFMDHPRARVAREERGEIFPGWLLRYVYRPLIGRTRAIFARELERYNARQQP